MRRPTTTPGVIGGTGPVAPASWDLAVAARRLGIVGRIRLAVAGWWRAALEGRMP